VIGIIQLREAGISRRKIGHLLHDLAKHIRRIVPSLRIEAEQRGLTEQPNIRTLSDRRLAGS